MELCEVHSIAPCGGGVHCENHWSRPFAEWRVTRAGAEDSRWLDDFEWYCNQCLPPAYLLVVALKEIP